jgi:photosystem II stability/assembly factor-like uncharacterized protein
MEKHARHNNLCEALIANVPLCHRGLVSSSNPRSMIYAVVLFGLIILLASPQCLAQTTPSASTADNLNGVAILDSNNGWAVGNSGTIEHFDGSGSTLVSSGTGLDIFGVSFGPPNALSSDSGFAVGGSGASAVALYRSPVSWQLATAGLSGANAKKLSSVFSSSSSDAWAVDSVSGAFWHWSGTVGLGGGWNEVSAASAGLNSVFMVSASEGWAVGVGGIIYHYTGGGWSPSTSPVGTTLNSVFMVNQNEGWSVGNSGTILHYFSGTWSGPISPSPTNQDLKAVFMLSQTEGWAVGASGTVLHYLSGGWMLASNQFGTSQNLNALSFFGENGWAVGDFGTIVPLGAQTPPQGIPSSTFRSVYLSSSGDGWIVGCSTSGCGSGAGELTLLHWNGNSYTRGIATATPTDLYSVSMDSRSDGWAVGGVGNSPALLHYNGGAWTQVPAPSVNGILRSVFLVDGSNGWAVGDNGAILRYDGGAWGSVSSPTPNTLRSVFMTDAGDGWAVGDGGTIVRYQNGQWVAYASPTSASLNSAFFLELSQGWAAGSGGAILHYNGLTWSPVAAGISANLNSIAQVNPQEAWAVGDSATILHWNGIGWYQVQPPSQLSGTPDLNSIFISTNGFGLIVGAPQAPGSLGTILQVSALAPVPELFNPQLVLIAVITTVVLLIIPIKLRTFKWHTR